VLSSDVVLVAAPVKLATLLSLKRKAISSSARAEACALAGSVVEGVTVSMDIEQLIYEAGRLQDAASLGRPAGPLQLPRRLPWPQDRLGRH
jgi:hypothetical protein